MYLNIQVLVQWHSPIWICFLELCCYFQALVDKFKYFFSIPYNEWFSRWRADPNFSDIFLHQIELISGRCFHFLTPENIKKPLVFWFFQGAQHRNGKIGQKWTKGVNRYKILINLLSVSFCLSLSLCLSVSLCLSLSLSLFFSLTLSFCLILQ